MPEYRGAPRKPVFKSGRIILNEKSKLDCAVHNISVDGACLQLLADYAIPARFDLVFDNLRRTCRVAWIKDKQVGVMFV